MGSLQSLSCCHRFFTWIFFCFLFYTGSAVLKTHYVEDLCSGWSHKTLFLNKGYSGILTSVPSKLDPKECTITIKPEHRFSVVLSVYKYNLSPEDQLTITDFDKINVALVGKENFPNEGKSIISENALIVRYSWDLSRLDGQKQKFQFIFTHVHDAPCTSDEFQCKNGKCISGHLKCDRHNHCGDNSDQVICDKQEEGASSEASITRGYKITKKQQEKSACRKFIIVGGEHDGKLGGTGPCYYKGPWKKDRNTAYIPCSSYEFECRNKNCIERQYVCDRHNNCGDNSDEDYCYLAYLGYEFRHVVLSLGVAGIAMFFPLLEKRFGKVATGADAAAFVVAM